MVEIDNFIINTSVNTYHTYIRSRGCLLCREPTVDEARLFQPPFSFSGKSFKLEKEEMICQRCVLKLGFLEVERLLSFKHDEVLYLSPYGGYLKELIHELKLGKNTELKLPLGRLLALRVFLEEEKKIHEKGIKKLFRYIFLDTFLEMFSFAKSFSYDILTFIPLHQNRLIDRGFNQSELLAGIAAQSLGLPLRDLLIRKEDTTPQGRLNRKKRLENIKGKFDLNPLAREESYLKKRILLVDDICTTGASLGEGTRVLLEKGAKSITSLVLCR